MAFCGSRLHGGVAELHVRAALEDLGHAVADLPAELIERVELGSGLGEVVVELGQLLLADLADLDLEDRGLAREVLGAVVVGEGDVEVGFSSPALLPTSPSSNSGRRRSEPSSTVMSVPDPPSNASPSTVPS